MSVRPADAAGLVLLRQPASKRGTAEVFLGRRHGKSAFMPGVYVFPGGRVCRLDGRPSGFAETLPPAPAGLDAKTRRRRLVFARAALRETFEETGLLVVRPGRARSQPAAAPAAGSVWRAYARYGACPAFDSLELVARAITPAGSPIRFHTRFFLAAGVQTRGELGGDGELEDLRWVPVPEAAALPMAEVTRLVLDAAVARVTARAEALPAALFAWAGARRVRGAAAATSPRAGLTPAPGELSSRHAAMQAARDRHGQADDATD